MRTLQRNPQPFLHIGTTSEGESITLTGQELSRFKWVQGLSGSGKSTFMAWLVLSLLRLNYTVVLIDPHADLTRLILGLLAATDFFKHPKSFERLNFIDFARKDAAPAFNVLKQEHINNYQVAQNFLQAIHRAWPSSSSTTALDNTTEYSAFVLAECGLPITPYLQRFLLDAQYRNSLLAKIKDQQIIQFFNFTFSDKVNSTLIASTMRRLDLLTFSPTLRHALGQRANILNFRSMWDKNVSCLISLGGLSESEKRLVGCLLLVSIEQHFLSRLDLPPERRSPVALIVDEAPLFISQDETSFTNILEQCRKAGATCTTFANQTITQLSKGMLGSLQNALPIIFKAGTQDSSELASRFYRPTVEENVSLFDLLSLTPQPTPGVFSTVRNMQEARMLFENLQRQEAIVMLPGRAVKIKTPTIPVNIDQKKLALIEHEYAKRLLTPLSHIEREQAKSNLVLVSSAPPSINRRTYQPATTPQKPLTLFTGDLEHDIHAALSHFSYSTLQQLASLLGREKSVNYLRKKLSSMTDEHKIAVTLLPRVSGGKPLQVYSAVGAGERKQLFLEHSLDCTQALLAGFHVPQIEPSLTLISLKDERTVKAMQPSSSIIPDGLVTYQTQVGECIHIALEIDRNTENRERIEQKYTGYPAYIKSVGLDALTIAFVVTAGDRKRVSSLMEQALETIGDTDLASLFLFAAVPVDTISPRLFLDPVFTGLDNSTQALIEKLY